MAGRRTAPAVILSEIERSELTGLAGRRKTAQAMALRARIVLTCAEGLQSKRSQPSSGWMKQPSASGAGGSPRGAWTASTTSRGRGRRARSRTHALKR